MESNGKPKGNAKNIGAGILALVGAIGSGLLWLGFILAEGFLGLLVILAVSMSEAEISDISTVLPFELYMTYFEININFLLPAFVAVFVLLATASFACLSRREQVKKTGIVLSVVGSALLLGCIVGATAVYRISIGICFCFAYIGLKIFCVAADWKKAFGNKEKSLT